MIDFSPASSDAESQMTESTFDLRPPKNKPLFNARLEIRSSIHRCLNSIKDFSREFDCLLIVMALFPLLICFALAGKEPDEENFSEMIFVLILKNWFSLSLYLGVVLVFCCLILRSISGAIVWTFHFLSN